MLEADLQERIRTMCADRALAVQHIENSLAGRVWLPGWPDLVIIGWRPDGEPPAILFRELKAMGQHLSPEQRRVGALLRAAGGDFAMWQPVHLIDGTIERELDAIAFRKLHETRRPPVLDRPGALCMPGGRPPARTEGRP